MVSISDLGKYIGSGSQGSVWQHASEPDKIIKVMKGFPLLKDGEMDAFQYDRYLERRMGATQWARDHDKWMFPPMANKMVLYLFRETMAMRKDNVSLPTGQVKVYAVDNQIFELKDMRRLYKTIVNNGQFGEASEEADHRDGEERIVEVSDNKIRVMEVNISATRAEEETGYASK